MVAASVTSYTHIDISPCYIKENEQVGGTMNKNGKCIRMERQCWSTAQYSRR